MNPSYTHITIILDRTGSMAEIREDTISGFNTFLAEQKAVEGEATLTLVQFDSQDPYEMLQHFTQIEEVPELTSETYIPRAATPLLDALGRGINDLAASLAKLPDAARPAKVVFAVITDGLENASTEFTSAQIIRMITEKQQREKWQFVFLSADLDAIAEACAHGFDARRTRYFDKTGKGTRDGWRHMSACMSVYRKGDTDEMTLAPDDDTSDAKRGDKS